MQKKGQFFKNDKILKKMKNKLNVYLILEEAEFKEKAKKWLINDFNYQNIIKIFSSDIFKKCYFVGFVAFFILVIMIIAIIILSCFSFKETYNNMNLKNCLVVL